MHRSPLRAARRRTGMLVALAAIAALAVAACSSGATASPAPTSAQPSVPLEGTSWRLTEYVGAGGRAVAVPASITITARFADGTISGSSGCNTYTAPYTTDGDRLQIGAIAGTKMACSGAAGQVESQYLQILDLVESYAATADTLEMRNGSGTITLRFVPEASPALVGTTWAATGINNGKGGVVGLVPGTKVSADFGEDGTISGTGGCNTFSGPYTVDGDSIDIGDLASTMMACVDEGVSQQETAFFAAMEAATTFAIAGDELELRDADGALQVSFRATLP